LTVFADDSDRGGAGVDTYDRPAHDDTALCKGVGSLDSDIISEPPHKTNRQSDLPRSPTLGDCGRKAK
jgi:hypothetical protein